MAAVTAASTVLFAPPAAYANHSWGGYHWARTSSAFTLQLGDNVDERWNSSLGTTSSDWSRSTVLDTTIAPGATRPRTCGATAGRVEVCNAAYGNTGWLGVASIAVTDRTHITAGRVRLNDTYFDTTRYNTSAWRNLVMCQEVGHTLGLDHQDETFDNRNLGTCMDYTDDPTSNQHPNAHDYEELATIYRHLDDSTTVGSAQTSVRALAQVGHDARSWGRAVAGSRASGHSTFVRQLRGGHTVITFVTWASAS